MASKEDPPPLKSYPFSPFTKRVEACLKPRVGVPGHVLYTQNASILLRWTGSSFQAVFTSHIFFVYMALLAISVGVFSSVEMSPGLEGAAVPARFASSLNSLCIFMLTFYVGQCFSEANARFENVCKTNGNITRFSALVGGIYSPENAHLLMRYINSIMHIYYFLLSGPMDDEKWSLLVRRGLLTDSEVKALQLQGSPGVVLYSWSVKAIRTFRPDGSKTAAMERAFIELIQAMEEQIGGARGLAAKQIAYTLYQIPSIYFHIVYVAVNAFLICTVYETGLAVCLAMNRPCMPGEPSNMCPSKVAMTIGTEIVSITLFLGLLLTAEGMSDIYGHKPFHYDLGVDLDGLWTESQNVLKSMAVECPSLTGHTEQV